MDHFDIARWADYVHGFISPSEREVMERHLEGCSNCRRLAELVTRIHRESAAEPRVPEELVRSAKAIFRPVGATPKVSNWLMLPRLAAQSIFDSLTSPQLEGARAAAAAEAHKVYHAGDYTIGLQIERDPESNEVALVGQVTDRSQSDRPLAGIPVLLTARDKVIASTVTNSFGEFCLVGRSLQGLAVRVPLESAGKQVVIPLAGTSEDRSDGNNVLRNLVCALLMFLALVTPASAANYILSLTATADINAFSTQYGFTLIKELQQRTRGNVYLVNGPDPTPAFITQVQADPSVRHIEADKGVYSSDTPSPAPAAPPVDPGTLASTVPSNNPISYFGSTVRDGYVNQWATALIELPNALAGYGSGSGVVAVIDTGVDPNHPVLQNVLVAGYDFVHDLPGIPTDTSDLNQDTVAILDQSNMAVVDSKTTPMILNQDTVAILDQDTVAILDASQVPSDFGHGTMVAGLIHLVAPTAQIMPLKAFSSDGTANLSDIVAAIYYAVDHQANIINMSFSSYTNSPAMSAAMNYARHHGVVCIASGGNDGREDILVYPAANKGVLGVGSTNAQDGRSDFSNYDTPSVEVSAPGEALVTSYPGNNYALVWGTSFSTALMSGAASLLNQVNPQASLPQLSNALKHGRWVHAVGIGERLDVMNMMAYFLYGYGTGDDLASSVSPLVEHTKQVRNQKNQ
jgi:subtilisin family serine protease